MKLNCSCRKKKGVNTPSLTCKLGVSVDIGVLEDIGHFVWYSRTIVTFKATKYISLDTPLSDEDLKILSNPDTSKLLIKLQHHLLGIIYYHNERIFSPWAQPSYAAQSVPQQYRSAYAFATSYCRRGRKAMPLPTKWAVFGFIDRALAGSSNT